MSKTEAMPSTAPSDADVAFEKAVGDLDFKGIEAALRQGADPNRPFADKWREGQGMRATFSLIRHFDRRDLSRTGLSAEAFAAAHASALRAMLQSGVDFSLSLFPGSGATTADPASGLWRSADGLDMTESVALFHQGKGKMDLLYGEGQFCGLLDADERLEDGSSLERLWEAGGLKERLGAQAMRSTLLTKLLGYGHLEAARWMAGKGVAPADLIEMGPTSREQPGQTALHLLALDTLNYCPREDGAQDRCMRQRRVGVDRAVECARLAVELGVDPNARAQGGSAAHFALWNRGQTNPEGAARWVLELGKLGAKPIATGRGVPFLGMALSDIDNAEAKLGAALEMGCDPKADGGRAALAMLWRCREGDDEAAARMLSRLRGLGADLSEGAATPEGESLQYAAARAGLWRCLEALYEAGCDPQWSCPKSGASVAGIVCQNDESAQSKPTDYDRALKAAIDRGAPLEVAGGEGLSPLHWAARHLSHRKCEALIKAGANPNQKTAKGDAPLHWACARHGARHEPRQKKTLEAFLESPQTDWSATDKKGRAPLAILSRKASPELLSLAAGVSPEGLDANTSSGAQARERLERREDGALAAVEGAILAGVAQPAKAPRARSRKGAL